MVGFCADLFDEIDERTHSVRLCLLKAKGLGNSEKDVISVLLASGNVEGSSQVFL
ncbi:uncharacterized protein PHALS_08905 [Plasmopara halstedii]|uniref:Uncharacterized protein n=1 Tax=Plasmopara halstedii TaxID=4781 RepID=A0A0P1AD56_PLAHL|nr:uncharacterized protein PHALS_08905 [Plasmopara halstedii]CEG38856.1 hypothetical protein PHALS_08905 [Plasmopara halstedii]|eukprot:XP_024575225.1 hypothetical protein PHALS_08905 [Plasmopara halstedii]